MPKATFRFYEELNRFLPEPMRKIDFQVDFIGEPSIEDRIKVLGGPPIEVDLILVNGKSVDFKYILQGDDRISVYPVFETLHIGTITRLRARPLRKSRFIADVDLGDVAKTMRVKGFDVHYDPTLSDLEIIEVSRSAQRIILTMNRKLLKSRDVTHVILVPVGSTDDQIRRIMDYLQIEKEASHH